MPKETPFQTILDALLDNTTTFPPRYLERFSDLDPASLKALAKVWPSASLRRKVSLLEDLQDLAEADTLVCFDNLARALLSDPEVPVRTGALHLLWECEDSRLVTPCLDLLSGDEDAEVRAAAAVVLGQFILLGELGKIPAETHHKVENALLAASRDDSMIVRRRALEALGASSREEVPALIEAAYREKDTDWMVSALFAMGRSGNPHWKDKVLPKLSNPDESIRAEAMQAAGELGLSSARPVLLDQLEEEEDPLMRHEIIWALSQIGGEGVRNRLEELFELEQDDEEAEFLEEAIQNLAFTEDLGPFDLFEFGPDEEDE